RLLHERPPVGNHEHLDDREPDRRRGRDPRTGRHRSRAGAVPHGDPDHPDAVLRQDHGQGGQGTGMSEPAVAPVQADVPLLHAARPRFRPWRDPWRKPRGLAGLTWLYLVWSIAPVAIAVLFSFNAGRSRSAWQGFSLRWYVGDPILSVWHDPDLHTALFQTLRLAGITTLIAVPIGVAVVIGIDRRRGRISSAFNFQMLLSFVLPELIIGVTLLFVISDLFTFIPLGTTAQVLGLITFQMSYP